MQVAAIKKLVENHSVAELKEAESAIMDGKATPMVVEGTDEGEQLTHVLGAIWILEKMEADGVEFREAQREFIRTVRGVL